MNRYKFCSLSKYHQGGCYFEWDMRWEPCPVEPRCMQRSRPIPEFERSPFLEPSYVRKVFVPSYVNVPADKVAGRLTRSEDVRRVLGEAAEKAHGEAPKVKVPYGRGVSIDQISHNEVPPKKPFSLVALSPPFDPSQPGEIRRLREALIEKMGITFITDERMPANLVAILKDGRVAGVIKMKEED